MTHPWEQHHRRAVAQNVTLDWSDDATHILEQRLGAPARILELGCGQGRLALRLAKAGHTVTALDVSPTAIGRAREAAAGLPNPPAFLLADITQPLPAPDQAFDAVVAVLSLHYFTRQVTASIVQEVRRVLTPEGWFCFYVNSTAEGRARLEQGTVKNILEPGLFSESDGMTRCYFGEDDLRDLLGGWQVAACDAIELASPGRLKACWRVLAQKPS